MRRASLAALSQTLGTRLTRRTGIAATLTGFAAALAGTLAEARVQIPPTCRSVGMQCATGDECCSGRCIMKSDGTSRCARKTSNRKKKKNGGGSTTPVGPTCTVCSSGCEYAAIESAVESALPGATITVAPGTYSPVRINSNYEGSILIQKDLTLTACDPSNPPIIDAGSYGNGMFTILVNASTDNQCDPTPINVVISDFIIRNSSDRNAITTQCNANLTVSNVEVYGFTLGNRPIIRLDGNGTHYFDNCDIHDNSGDSYRGAIVKLLDVGTNTNATLELHDCDIHNNASGTGVNEGGIVGTSSRSLTLSGTTKIRNNTVPAGTYGGGVFVAGSTLYMEDSASITSNGTPAAGGGVCLKYGGLVSNASASNVSQNTAGSCNNIYDVTNSLCILT
ncbi:MAG: hypothetical protein ACKOCK_09790 [Chloroflexota bacterium]